MSRKKYAPPKPVEKFIIIPGAVTQKNIILTLFLELFRPN
jgi:hypothetical protein